jgi:oligopeptide transport system substrate-binding protein
MRKVKWIFFGYLALVGALICFLGFSLVLTPPRRSDTYYTFYIANLKTLDPAEINDVESAGIVGNIFETLYNYEYGVEPYRLFPQLAADMPLMSADGKTMTIKLRKGIHFYDPWKKVFPDGKGPEIKAQDFIYSWKRVSDFHLGNTANYGAMFEGKIVGLEDWWNYTKSHKKEEIDWDRPVAGWTALDDYTIQIKLVQPYPQLRFNLAHMPTSAVCRQAVEKLGDDFKKYPIGSGPFVMTDNLPEQRVVLEANPIYRGRMDVDGYTKVSDADRLPRMKRVQVDYFSEPVPRWLLFRQGFFDVSTIPRDAFNQAVGSASGELTPEMVKDGVVLKKSEVAELFYTGFNMLDKVVGKNKPLRQAISMAYDRDAFIRIHLNGRGVPANGPIPPGFPTYDPKAINPYTQFNLAAAKEKLAEAEKINGGPIPELTYLMGGTETQSRQYAEFFVSQMAQIGLKVKFELRTWARFQEMVDDKQAQIFSLGWVADYPDEQTFLQLFYGKNTGVGGVNSSNYMNPEFDKLYEAAVVMEPGPQRDVLYRKMQDVVREDCPWVYEFYPLAYTLRYNWVNDYFPMEYGNGQKMSWAYVKIDTAARERWHQRKAH